MPELVLKNGMESARAVPGYLSGRVYSRVSPINRKNVTAGKRADCSRNPETRSEPVPSDPDAQIRTVKSSCKRQFSSGLA